MRPDGGGERRAAGWSSAGLSLLLLTVLAAWVCFTLAHRTSLRGLPSVRALDGLAFPRWAYLAGGAGLLLALLTLIRRPGWRTPGLPAALALLLVGALAPPLVAPAGHHAPLAVAALLCAVLAGAQLPAGALRPTLPRHTGLYLWGLATLVHALYSMHRHARFGSGSWDMGCMVHNFYRASRFLDSTSTVLGDVDYLGDHFMPGIYLYAPLFWVWASGYTLLFIQSANLGAVAPVIFSLARRSGAGPLPALALALAAAFAFGIQSAAYFDSHEIAVGFGFLALALWALEHERFTLATAALVIFALFKESLGAYVVALGLFLVWRGLQQGDRRRVLFGLGWVVYGALWFVLVNRVFMPALIARGNPPEPHETFADFGPTVLQAALGIVQSPLKALAALVTPPDEKLNSLLVTLLGVGGLALCRPEVLLAALPLLAERLLSSKSSMWEMGYHYAAPLSLYAAWAAATAWPRIERGARALLAPLGEAERAPPMLALYVLAAAALTNSIGYRHPANYHRLDEPYFSTPERTQDNRGAVALLREEGRGARVAVQNRILPHLADRPVVYRLGEWAKTDWVLLNTEESAWPWDDGLPLRLARQLAAEPGWRLIYAQGTTAVFARTGATTRPAVAPSPELGRRLGPTPP